ncbi:MAG: hypothetical protein HRF43_07605, partial [Phycisphaerae bacterium]
SMVRMAPGESAKTLGAGTYTGSVAFANAVNAAGNVTVPVRLVVQSPAGPAPVVVLSVPAPSAPRMSPAPVFAAIDFEKSSTGSDGGDWDQCKITWTLSRNGGLEPWPASYRYVRDPRGLEPGQSLEQGPLVDLATAGRGFNMGWLLTDGAWTIRCTVVNKRGQSTTVAAPAVSVAANTRMRKYVNGTTGVDATGRGVLPTEPYKTLSFALSQHGASANVEYVLAGGHVENLAAAALVNVRSNNTWVHWDGSGTIPTLTCVNAAATDQAAIVQPNVQGAVLEGLRFVPGTVSTGGQGLTLSGTFNAVVGVRLDGQMDGARFASAFLVGPPGDRMLFQGCSTGAADSWAFGWVTHPSDFYTDTFIIGNDFGPGLIQSMLRTTSDVERLNLMYNRMNGANVKSCLRLVTRRGLHAYGNRLSDGDLWLGRTGSSDRVWTESVRVEANRVTGSGPGGSLLVVYPDVLGATVCNNVFEGSGRIAGFLAAYNRPTDRVRMLCNTLRLVGDGAALVESGDPLKTACTTRANLVTATATQTGPQAVFQGTVGLAAYQNNVWAPTGPAVVHGYFLVAANRGYLFNQWTGEPWKVNDQQVETSLGADFTPAPKTPVPTPEGVFDDYYGRPRGTTCTAGAVN